jgi:hypothetical protein
VALNPGANISGSRTPEALGIWGLYHQNARAVMSSLDIKVRPCTIRSRPFVHEGGFLPRQTQRIVDHQSLHR